MHNGGETADFADDAAPTTEAHALSGDSALVDDAIEDYYDEHKAEYGTETQLHVMHIVTNSADDAVVAYRALLDGTPFAVAARRFAAEDAPAEAPNVIMFTPGNN